MEYLFVNDFVITVAENTAPHAANITFIADALPLLSSYT